MIRLDTRVKPYRVARDLPGRTIAIRQYNGLNVFTIGWHCCIFGGRCHGAERLGWGMVYLHSPYANETHHTASVCQLKKSANDLFLPGSENISQAFWVRSRRMRLAAMVRGEDLVRMQSDSPSFVIAWQADMNNLQGLLGSWNVPGRV